MKRMMKPKTEKACFGAGCFWGVQYVFDKFPGILKTDAGYMGGKMKNPSYEAVCSSLTGHAEVVYIKFNPAKISYDVVLEIFFKCHDPTTMNRQGPDAGNQYRSAIFYYSAKQKAAAEKFLKVYEKELGKKIVTSIEPAKEFYSAEDYHQKYYDQKHSVPYCHIVPKVKI